MRKFKKRYIVLSINLLILLMTMSVFNLNAMNMNSTSSKKTKKYILYECSTQVLCGGLVDRYKGIINAYAWSLFTKRQLIVSISKPCDFINLMVPNLVKWNIDLDQLVKNDDLKTNYTIHKIDKLDSFNYKSDLANIDIMNYEKTKDIIIIFTNLELISSYAQNKYVFVLIKLRNKV